MKGQRGQRAAGHHFGVDKGGRCPPPAPPPFISSIIFLVSNFPSFSNDLDYRRVVIDYRLY
jgi:hypothetical protein